jgi:hypothetical protein
VRSAIGGKLRSVSALALSLTLAGATFAGVSSMAPAASAAPQLNPAACTDYHAYLAVEEKAITGSLSQVISSGKTPTPSAMLQSMSSKAFYGAIVAAGKSSLKYESKIAKYLPKNIAADWQVTKAFETRLVEKLSYNSWKATLAKEAALMKGQPLAAIVANSQKFEVQALEGSGLSSTQAALGIKDSLAYTTWITQACG